MISTIVSIWLIDKHLQWYTNVRSQPCCVRLLLLTTFSSERSKDVSVLLMVIGANSNDARRYCSATVHGPDLCFDQFRIVLVLGEEKHLKISARYVKPRWTESIHAPDPRPRLLRSHCPHLVLLPSPYLPFSGSRGTKANLPPQRNLSRERPSTQKERPETSEMDIAPWVCQVQASGKHLRLAVSRAPLR